MLEDVQTTAFHALKLTHRGKETKTQVSRCFGLLCVSVLLCVCVSMQPCMVAKQTLALALCTTAAEKGFSHHLSPPTISLFLFFLSLTCTSFSLSFPAPPFPYDRIDCKLSPRSHCLRKFSP